MCEVNKAGYLNFTLEGSGGEMMKYILDVHFK